MVSIDHQEVKFSRGGYSSIKVTGPGEGTPQLKGLGMLVVSLRSVNFGFWSPLGCSGQNAIIFSRVGLV